MQTNNLNVFLKQKVLGNTIKNFLVRFLFPFRNSFILFNVTCHAKKNRVNLNYWFEKPNLGDDLSLLIVNYMLSLKGLTLDKAIRDRRHLYAVGSIITAGLQDCTIWGSGVLKANMLNRIKGRKLDVRAVRGPLTRVVLSDLGYKVPEVYGDPVIILPEIYSPSPVQKIYKYGIVSQKDQVFSDMKDIEFLKRSDILLIDIKTRNYKEFVDKLLSVKRVISSSLHGIIIAEAYGIPSVMHNPTTEPLFKYCDWYYSTGRLCFPTIMELEDVENVVFPPLPNLDNLRENLKDAFPYDLFYTPVRDNKN